MKTASLALMAGLLVPGLLTGASLQVPEQHATVQAAIDASTSGDTILVSAGTYHERIALKPGVTLRSAGNDAKGKLGLKRAEATILDGGGGSDKTPGVAMAEGAILDGFTVTNVGRYDDAKWQRNWDEKGRNQKHSDIGHFGVPAVAVIGVTCEVINNLVHHNGDIGIAIRGAKGKTCAPRVSRNVSYRNMGGGIGSMMGSIATIDSNHCFENLYAGIGHDNASPVVTGNNCHDNVRAGIGISEGACPIVRGNRCHANRRAGIGIRTGATTRPVVEDNDCVGNGMAGIGIEEEAEPIIRGNRCLENELAGIGVHSASPSLLRNVIERNKTAGIGVDGNAHVTAIGNTCRDNRLVAVGIPAGGSAVLQDNTFIRSEGKVPMIAILKGGHATLTGNTIKGTGMAGIMVDGHIKAFDNVIEGQNGGAGIMIRKGSEAELSGNRISGYRMPIRDQNAAPAPKPQRPK